MHAYTVWGGLPAHMYGVSTDSPQPSAVSKAAGEFGGIATSAAAGAAKGGLHGAAAGAAKQIAVSTMRDPRKRRWLVGLVAVLVGIQLLPLTLLGLAGGGLSGGHTNPSIPGATAVKAGVTTVNLALAQKVGARHGVSWEVLASLLWTQAQGGFVPSAPPLTGPSGTVSTPTTVLASDWRVPVVGEYVITSPFGWRTHPIYGDRRLHRGVDIVMRPAPGAVVAAASGTVVSAGVIGGGGNAVRLDHGGGVETVYMHLASFADGITPGVSVSAGQVLGIEGSTGDSTGAHLHFQVEDGGTAVDPVPFMAQYGVLLSSGSSGDAGTGDVGVGAYSGTGVGPLRITPGSEPPNATNLEAALTWAALSMRSRMDYRTDISAGMVVSDSDAVIDSADPAAQAARTQYLAGLSGLPVAGMNQSSAGRIYDQALAWRLGKSYTSSGSAYGVVCDTSAFGTVTAADGNGDQVTLNAGEMRNVGIMVTVAKQAGLSERSMVIAAAVMGQESRFLNRASRAVPESLNYPNEGVDAGDHKSIGLFQQQAGLGWGTVAQIMDPVHAAQAFFGISDSSNPGLTDLPSKGFDIENDPLTVLAQAVQISAYPDAYAKWEPVARAAVGAALGVSCSTNFATLADASAAAATVVNAGRAWLGTPYSYGGGDLNGPTLGIQQGAGTVGFDCSGLTRYAYNKAGISLPRTADGQYRFALNAGKVNTDITKIGVGELVFFGTTSHIHHVGIYIGGNQILHAPHTGDVVKISDFTASREAEFVASSTLLAG